MTYSYNINGLSVQTGDIICTTDGGGATIPGEFWWAVGKLIPGDVDHIVVYVGPEGRCIEAGPKGVITFGINGNVWDARTMKEARYGLIDTFYGVSYPLKGRAGLSDSDVARIRESVAQYCLAQAGKPYNINFIDSQREDAFYCSQLAYMAYLKNGIDLNTGSQIAALAGTEKIIFPQELWDGCPHAKAP